MIPLLYFRLEFPENGNEAEPFSNGDWTEHIVENTENPSAEPAPINGEANEAISGNVETDTNTETEAAAHENMAELEAELYMPINTVDKPPEITALMDDGGDILLDDKGIKHNLNSYEKWLERRRRRARNAPRRERLLKIWRRLCPILAAICSVIVAVLVLYTIGGIVVDKLIRPVNSNDASPVIVEIPSGSGASAIAKILYEAGGEDAPGLISNKAAFKIYVDFKGKAGGLKAGTYVLSRNMDIAQIVDIICSGNPPRQTVEFTISEGMTIDAIGARLVSLGILESADRFLELCKTGEEFAESYNFIKAISTTENMNRLYLLEGYLFPDTYEIFVDATEETIIEKMLTRFQNIYSKQLAERAEELGLTMDEVIILASMIEKEGKTFDFTKISAVFHNRLSSEMTLGSDATLEYIFRTGGLSLTQEQLSDPTPYNTHLYPGLPLGPIANPGLAAISAALNPDEQYLTESYLYFCLMDSSTGALAFARTLEEHRENVEKYSPGW